MIARAFTLIAVTYIGIAVGFLLGLAAGFNAALPQTEPQIYFIEPMNPDAPAPVASETV